MKNENKIIISCFITIFLLTLSCKKEQVLPGCPDCPSILSAVPLEGAPGTIVTLSGRNFTNIIYVNFGEIEVIPESVENGNTIVFIVPETDLTGSVPIRVARRFTAGSGSTSILLSNEEISFSLERLPVITSLQPLEVSAGVQITIDGQFFTDDLRVFFPNGEATEIISRSAERIVARVPAKAGSGPIRLGIQSDQAVESSQNLTYQYSFTTELFAGTAGAGPSLYNVPALEAKFSIINFYAFDNNNNLIVADQISDQGYFNIVRISAENPNMTTILQENIEGTCFGVFVDSNNNIYYTSFILGNPELGIANRYINYRLNQSNNLVTNYGGCVGCSFSFITVSNDLSLLNIEKENISSPIIIYRFQGLTPIEIASLPADVRFNKFEILENGILFGGSPFYFFAFSNNEVTNLQYNILLDPIFFNWTYDAYLGRLYFGDILGIKYKTGDLFDPSEASTFASGIENRIADNIVCDNQGNMYIRWNADRNRIYKATLQ